MPTNPDPKALSETPRVDAELMKGYRQKYFSSSKDEVDPLRLKYVADEMHIDFARTLEKELNEANLIIKEFVNRCESGEIRSAKTYNQFKEYLKKYERH